MKPNTASCLREQEPIGCISACTVRVSGLYFLGYILLPRNTRRRKELGSEGTSQLLGFPKVFRRQWRAAWTNS